ncbi:PIP5K4 [Symbiodinium necroappetens]|uniref:PIP5K4 protein n=1 Tax=Symbiodinium necroappetens TaxID=1628268 RepID=A0A812ZME2_9DINO|nr:PIP5K4 [Symbiodinium necroappetens]
MSIPGNETDFTGFFHAAIAHLACRPDCSSQWWQFEKDPAVKATWAALGLQQPTPRMEDVLAARPDLFSRSHNGKNMVLKLQALGLSCLPSGPEPPPVQFPGHAMCTQLRCKGPAAKWGGPWAARAGGYMKSAGSLEELGAQKSLESLRVVVCRPEGASSAGLNRSSRLIILWQPDAKRDHHKQNLAVLSNVSGVFAQSRNKSRIYVHVKACITEPNSFRCGRKMLHMLRAPREDLADGLQSLTAGQRVAFQAVSDAPDCPFDVANGCPTLSTFQKPSRQHRFGLRIQKWAKALAAATWPSANVSSEERFERPTVLLEHGIKYTGQWKGDKRDGNGLQEWPDGARFDGQWRNGLAEGFGKFIHADGDVYEGQWKDDKANGEGVYHHADGSRYVGEWKDDQKEGRAMEEWADNSRFEGEYRAGKKHGHGTFTWPEGSSYEGEFQNNEIHGQGTYFWNDGRVYCGQWANNRMSGQGTFTWRDGRKYIGSYMYDKKDGHGVFTWPDGREYVGDWKDGKQHGIGVFKTAKGDYRRGEWKDGSRIRWISEAYREDGQQPGSPSAPQALFLRF